MWLIHILSPRKQLWNAVVLYNDRQVIDENVVHTRFSSALPLLTINTMRVAYDDDWSNTYDDYWSKTYDDYWTVMNSGELVGPLFFFHEMNLE